MSTGGLQWAEQTVDRALEKKEEDVTRELLMATEQVKELVGHLQELGDDHAATLQQLGTEIEEAARDQRILDAIERLSERERLVFVLSEIEGFSLREVAEIMDLSYSTVAQTERRARERLREVLGTSEIGPEDPNSLT